MTTQEYTENYIQNIVIKIFDYLVSIMNDENTTNTDKIAAATAILNIIFKIKEYENG